MDRLVPGVFVPAVRRVPLCLKDARCLENCNAKSGPCTSSTGTPGSSLETHSLGPRQTYGLSIYISAKLPGSRGLVAAASLLDGLLPFTLQPLDALEHSRCRVPRPGATSSPSSSPSRARPSPCLLRVVPAGSGLLTPPKHREVLR